MSKLNPATKLKFTESAPAGLTEDQLDLANDLSMRHGTIRVTREASGVHFYMASPECLARDGRIELSKLHLAGERRSRKPRQSSVNVYRRQDSEA